MGMSIYPAFEREFPGMILMHVEGKDLNRATQIQPELLAPLLKFSSVTDGQLEELRLMEMEGEWQEMTDERLPTVEWFDALDGIAAVQQVLNALFNDRNLLQFSGGDPNFVDGVIEDLKSIEQNLSQAATHQIRFHLVSNF